MKDKNILLVYNKRQKNNNYSDETADYFSDKEFAYLKSLANKSEYYIEFIEGELNFIHSAKKYIQNRLIVINLTRGGSTGSVKTLVSSYCDLNSIVHVGSYALTVNLCRDMQTIYSILQNRGLQNHCIESYYLNDPKRINLMNNYVFIKHSNSAGSKGITDKNKLFYRNDIEFINHIENNDFELSEEYVVQKFIEGIEFEVPFLIDKYNEITILGFYKIVHKGISEEKQNNKLYLDSAKANDSNYDFEEIFIKDEEFMSNIHHIIKILKIRNYGRLDFRVDHIDNIAEAKLFDIATTPFFTEGMSFELGLKKNEINIFDYFIINSTL